MKRFLTITLGLVLLFGSVVAAAPPREAAAVETTPLVPVRTTGTLINANDEFVLNLKGDWPPEAIRAAEAAASNLASQIRVTVPVEVALTWEPLDDFLGLGGSRMSLIDFPGAPRAGTYYPLALANQLAGHRLDAGPDIEVSMNSQSDWDYSGEPQKAFKAGKSDFVTTAMHEIIHGMAFLGTADIVDGLGKWGDDDGSMEPEHRKVTPHAHCHCGAVAPIRQYSASAAVTNATAPDVYDLFVADGKGVLMVDSGIENPSEDLADFLQSDDLFWKGARGIAANGSKPVKLYAPTEWEVGSSYSHLDDQTYDGGANALLTSAGEDIPNVKLGPVVIAILADMGWIPE
jgi:hypothetical protein